MTRRVERVVIVGRDAPAYIAAAAIQQTLGRTGVTTRVVELPTLLQPADVYSAVPSLKGLHDQLGVDEQLVLRVCDAVPLVGQRFSNWSGPGTPFIYGYDDEPSPGSDLDFVQYWIKGRHEGLRSAFENFSVGAMAAKAGRIPIFSAAQDHKISASYGYQLDAGRYSALMREVARRRGVDVRPGRVAHVDTHGEEIGAIVLDGSERVEADLFVDASGAEGMLIGRLPGSEFESWRQWLPCDRMIVASGAKLPQLPAFAQVSAFRDGWVGIFPLASRTAVIGAYDSRKVADQQMLESMPVLARVPMAGDAVVADLRQGIRTRTWTGNCVAIGEAAFALEPLDGIQLHGAHSCISNLLTYFPVEAAAFPEAAVYDRALRRTAINMRDFQVAHYALNRRFDDPFWDHCRRSGCPATLQSKIDVFAARGHVVLYDDETFGAQNWASIFLGHGLSPQSHDPRVDLLPQQEQIARVHQRLHDIVEIVGAMPSAEEFIANAIPQPSPEALKSA